ncbi:NUDIX hydrolase [Polynucleobacter kasalickyi]|uniref:NUDIX domain-containing protein n=1 Tax=Polynucleobacter kasalickyi TaxID=1938817 RepID=A0A1W2CIQ9_9BURK|nr:NUDIX domain-containing protein [Polynucleobacter kasalickyi]SMC85127.1 NUDIX domain-containing protein [Polynucleobacter kasalickyi]
MKLNYVISDSIQSALNEIIETAYRSIPNQFVPVYYVNQLIGSVSASCFSHMKELFNQDDNDFSFIQINNDSILLSTSSSYDLSLELRILAEFLRSKGVFSHWRNEQFSFLREDAHEIFRLERAAFRGFGLMSTAVHINGFTRDGSIWLATRSDSKSVDPGLIDNMTAGGINAIETVQSCAERELWEEAGVVSNQLNNLFPAGLIEVRRFLPPHEIHHEKIFTFDLFVDENWTPINHDGEVQSFQKHGIEEVIDFILSEKMTQDAAVVTADFILRNLKI